MKSTLLLVAAACISLMARSQRYVDGSGICSGNTPCYSTVQAAVNAAGAGETIYVYPGVYNEKIIIEKSLTLQSTGGKDVTTLQYTTTGNYIAPLMIQADAGTYSGVTIGGSQGAGFTIIGSDVSNDVTGGNFESAAIIIGSNSPNGISGINISYNTITANGDLALFTYFKSGSLYDNIFIQHNVFNGKTYTGTPQAGGNNAHGNVARQLIAVNQGVGNLSFTNNSITGTTGEMVGASAVGNMVVTLDAASSVIRENYFEPVYVGSFFSPRYALRVGGSGSVVQCNYFSLANAGSTGTGYINARTGSSYIVANVASGNTFQNPGGVISGNNINRYTGSGTAANSSNPAPGCTVVLPVIFDRVTASVSGKQLQVSWTTLSETHNAYFQVQVSADGLDFTDIGSVDSKAADGSSSAGIQYHFSKALGSVAVFGLSLLGLFSGLWYRGLKRSKAILGVLSLSCLVVIGARCSAKPDGIDRYPDKLYVRVAQVDKDGGKTYSGIVLAHKE